MSKNYTAIKKLMFTQPEVLHALLQKLADAVVDYIAYQHEAGAQVVQVFDSWAAQLSPQDFDVFAGPYLGYIFRRDHRHFRAVDRLAVAQCRRSLLSVLLSFPTCPQH